MVVSYDCLLEDTRLNLFGSSDYIFKTFVSVFIPFFLIALTTLFWMVAYALLICCRKKINLKRYIIVSIISIMLLMYPNTSSMILSLFKCREIGGLPYLERDMMLECWKGSHQSWAYFFGIPYMIFWVFGLPLLGIVFLTINRKNVQKQSFKDNYLVLYQGLKNETYYWEFCNILRKVLLVMVNVFFATDAYFYKAITGLVIMVVFLRL